MKQAGDGLVIILDALHKLMLHSNEWLLFQVIIKENYSEKKVEALKKAKKKFIVVEDKNGKKQIGEWKPTAKRYSYSQLGTAISDWVMTAMVNRFPINSNKLSIDDVVSFFKSIEKKLAGLSILSSMLTFRIKMDMLSSEDLLKIDEEIKRNNITQGSDGTRGRRRQINIGPEVVLTPVVVNQITKDSSFKVVDASTKMGPLVLRGFGSASDYIKLPDIELPDIEPKVNPFKKKSEEKTEKKHKVAKLSSDKKKHRTAKLK